MTTPTPNAPSGSPATDFHNEIAKLQPGLVVNALSTQGAHAFAAAMTTAGVELSNLAVSHGLSDTRALAVWLGAWTGFAAVHYIAKNIVGAFHFQKFWTSAGVAHFEKVAEVFAEAEARKALLDAQSRIKL